MAAARAGADRQALHARLRDHAMAAWEAVRSGVPNPLLERLAADPEITRWLSPETLQRLMEVHTHIGDAPQRARAMAQEIRRAVASSGPL